MDINYELNNFDSSKAYLEFRNFKPEIHMRKKSLIELIILYIIIFLASTLIIKDENLRRMAFITLILLFVICYFLREYLISALILLYATIKKNEKHARTIKLCDTTINSTLHKGNLNCEQTEQILYSQISHIQQSKSYISILDIQERYFAIIPNRAFSSGKDKDLFLETLKNNTGLEIEQL